MAPRRAGWMLGRPIGLPLLVLLALALARAIPARTRSWIARAAWKEADEVPAGSGRADQPSTP
jgi:hypothetical protein